MTLLEIPHKTKGSLDPLKCIKQPISYFAKLLNNKNVHSQQSSGNDFLPGFLYSWRERRGEGVRPWPAVCRFSGGLDHSHRACCFSGHHSLPAGPMWWASSMALISLGLMGAALSSVTLYTKKLGENKNGGGRGVRRRERRICGITSSQHSNGKGQSGVPPQVEGVLRWGQHMGARREPGLPRPHCWVSAVAENSPWDR